MAIVFYLIGAACGIGSLICFIMVVIKMFQDQQTGLGIACIVLALCGIGFLVAFVVGWMNVGKWGIQQVMYIWTGCFVGSILANILTMAFANA